MQAETHRVSRLIAQSVRKNVVLHIDTVNAKNMKLRKNKPLSKMIRA